jgi:hypothetical protein
MTAVPAYANTFSATELTYDDALLSQFNLIDLGNYNGPTGTTSVSVSGRAVTGSETIGTYAQFCQTNCSGNTTIGASSSTTAGVTAPTTSNLAYGALTVFGSVTGNTVAGGGGNIFINGNIVPNANAPSSASLSVTGGVSGSSGSSTGLYINGVLSSGASARDAGALYTTQTQAAFGSNVTGITSQNYSQALANVFPFASEKTAFGTPLQNLYSGLANLPGSPGVSAESLPAAYSGVFTASTDYTANGKSYGVVTTTLANFEAEGTSFTGVANGSGDAATFVIITGTGGTLPTITNSDPKVIYDFVSASSLTVNTAFDGTILAPLASLTQGSGGTINGTVVVASITENANLYNTNAFTGDLSGLTNFSYNARVPEPASIAIFGSGMAGLAWLRRKRKK